MQKIQHFTISIRKSNQKNIETKTQKNVSYFDMIYDRYIYHEYMKERNEIDGNFIEIDFYYLCIFYQFIYMRVNIAL
jgi:hypothetical protein